MVKHGDLGESVPVIYIIALFIYILPEKKEVDQFFTQIFVTVLKGQIVNLKRILANVQGARVISS